MNGNVPQLLTVGEVAQILRISRTSVHNLIARGELPALRFGRTVRIPATAIVRMVEKCLEEGDASAGGR